MNYEEVFLVFWEQVKESIQEGRFAKLTMAKTIGKPDLKNIFVRPISFEKDTKVAVKFRFRSKETEDTLNEYTLAQAFEVLKLHLKTSFLSVLLFTTTKDVTFKINKKGAGSITESFPTFQNVTLAENNMD